MKISIIIPAYNAERTIERTVKSVLASTIPVEIWVVDDGSTDGTGTCLEKLGGESRWTAEGSTLHVFRQENQGAYMARLNALKQITTPYFGFVDADDEIEPTMFEKMLDKIEAERLDAVQCWSDQVQERFASRDDYVNRVLLWGRGSSFVWDKLYRNQFDFASFEATDHLTNFDDLILNWQFFRKIRSMGFIDEPLYRYVLSPGSAVHRFRWGKVKDYLACARIRRKLAPTYGIRPWGACNGYWMAKNARNLAAFAVSCLIGRWK